MIPGFRILDRFGILDRAYVIKSRLRRRIDPYDKAELVWDRPSDSSNPKNIWFLPANVYDDPLRTANVVKGSSYVFRVHGNAFTPNPREVRDYLEDLSGKVMDIIDSGDIPTDMPISGVSLGGILANYIANRFPFTSLYLRTPGDDLALCIRESILTRAKYIEGGFSPGKWDEELCNLNPLNNLDNLPEDIRILLAERDLIVPFDRGRGLVEAIKAKGKKPIVEIRKFSGHRVSYAPTNLFD